MKLLHLYLLIIAITLVSCGSNKHTDSEKLYNTTWELEYISGSRIAFNGLYPDKKPKIKFDKTTGKVTGNNSCNGYSADYTLENNNISFGAPGPTTMMFCGSGEQQFLKIIKQINTFSFNDNGKLNLLLDDVAMMRFKKVEN
ncbi:lipoprotein [Tamlana nanhaiensis]|uniref:Lipoprotein n=1 Tax=Neotamlana nanhaiensis TaxID=1382798 RepID=A0A0D7WA29_9FLAO|nr:META domain-containing protein [Tamlana nanhaiensis]KJD34612.1 lipoprotein [Tamlana nanhaiensis]